MEINELKVDVILYLGDEEKARECGESICNLMKGNQDFIDNNVVINYTDDPGRVHISIYENTSTETILQLLRI